MTEQEFWESTPRTFFYRLEGFSELNGIKQQVEWERVRWLGALLLQPHMKKGKRLRPQDLMVFEWEKKESKPMTKDEQADFDKWEKEVSEVKHWKKL